MVVKRHNNLCQLHHGDRRTTPTISYKLQRLYNYVPNKIALEAGIEAAYEAIKEADEILNLESTFQGVGYLPYIKKACPPIRPGTRAEVDNFIRHTRQGCFSDPLSPEEMSVPIDPDDRSSHCDSQMKPLRLKDVSVTSH